MYDIIKKFFTKVEPGLGDIFEFIDKWFPV